MTVSRQKNLLTLPLLLSLFYCLPSPLHLREETRELKMKGTSKVIMGATLVMLVSLAIVLGLILVLLVELYCSLLLRRRQLRNTTSTTTTTTTINNTPSQPLQTQDHSASPLSTFYAHGVLDAPRSFLFPAVSSKENKVEKKNQSFQLHRLLDIHTQESNTSPRHIGIISPSSPPTSFITSPQPIQETSFQVGTKSGCNQEAYDGGGGEHFVYISNPIYDNDANRLSRADTPFETPDTSPSRLETGDSSGEDEIAQPSPSSPHSLPITPPLTPMKKLPAEACSVSLRDARSLGTSGSDSVSNNGLSSSSSGSPCTSPSW